MTSGTFLLSLSALCIALLYQLRRGPPPNPTDPLVSKVSAQFQTLISQQDQFKIQKRGVLNWDQDTFVWNRLAEKFGSNPNTPYMYNILPLGGLLPSPMWRLQPHDVVVLIFRRPPPVEYYSFTPFCLGSWKRGLVFASLGDSLNSHSPIMKHNQTQTLFAHVVVTESSGSTLTQIKEILIKSGVAEDAIHVAVIPNSVAEEDTLAFYEVVLRLFRFRNQTEGYAYLQSKQPVFYIQSASSPQEYSESKLLPKPSYKDRSHDDSVDEPAFYQNEFTSFQINLLAKLNTTYDTPATKTVSLNPLYIRGLHCLEQIGHQCLGDSPDAVYFGSNIVPTSEHIHSLRLLGDDEFHLATLVDHRHTEAAIYSSIALLKTHKPILNKTQLEVRGTSIGVLTNHEYHNNNHNSAFFSWIFTRNPDHCSQTYELVDGCTVLDEQGVSRNSYFAYCERLYLNPVTGTGPDWDKVLPAQVYHYQNVRLKPPNPQQANALLYARLRVPAKVPLKVFEGSQKLKFLHIIKTGGEAFEGYLWRTEGLKMDYPVCWKASKVNVTSSMSAIEKTPCWALATAISSLLCGLNCECCASDLYHPGGFHGTLLRSPRSHTLSLFSHGHNVHHTTWGRMASDVSLYLAERVLFASEVVCGHSGTGGVADWKVALEDNLKASLSSWPMPNSAEATGVQVISLRNTQSHSLTCSKQNRGSLGQHFRVLPSPDALEPTLDDALEALNRLEWVGITDLYHPSLCLLHYQANQTLPAKDCDCRHPNHHTNDPETKPLGYWVEYRTKRRSLGELSHDVLEMIDAHTTIDAQVFVAAMRLVLGRLRRVEELTGASILECIDWQKFKRKTNYIPGLWTGSEDSLLADE